MSTNLVFKILTQQANRSALVSTQAQTRAQENIDESSVQFLELFRKNKHNETRQAENPSEESHVLKAAPLFSGSVHNTANRLSIIGTQPVSQYGVLGMISDDQTSNSPCRAQEKLLFSNVEEPWSAFICGSQGSGKSHTLSCLLENNLLPDPKIGTLKTPLTGLVFHYDKLANFGKGQVCEAAYLCSAPNGGVPVQVLVAPTSLKRMTHQYHNLPGLPKDCTRPKVLPLYLSQDQLSVDTMMTLMAVNDDETRAPLYISAIRQLLREIAFDTQDAPGFNYHDFRQRLACLALTGSQTGPLILRLQLLQSFLLEEEQTMASRMAFAETWKFKPGTLTIIDLSDQFVSETDACAVFSICLKIFMADWQSNPRIVALDEAHKFLIASVETTKLTTDLVSIIRQQRHVSARVIVATQEPTVSETFLDLCNVSIIHRFNSPRWYHTLQQHLAGACVDKEDREMMFAEIVKLSTGEALVFCPTAALEMNSGKPVPLQDGVVKITVRDRISADGGQSMQASFKGTARGSEVIPDMPEYQRFNGEKMPAPGSLARRSRKKHARELATTPATARNNVSSSIETLPRSSRVLRSTATDQTVFESLEVSASAANYQSIAQDIAPVDVADDSDIYESANSDQDSDYEPQNLPAVVCHVEDEDPVRILGNHHQQATSQTIAIRKRKLKKGHYAVKNVSEDEVRLLMYQVVCQALDGKDVVKDPTPFLYPWLTVASQLCGASNKYLIKHGLEEGCSERSAVKFLKKIVKGYYDNRDISQQDRCSWLRD